MERSNLKRPKTIWWLDSCKLLDWNIIPPQPQKKVLNGMHPHLLAEEIPHGGLFGTTAQDCEEDDQDEGLEARAGNTGNATEEL